MWRARATTDSVPSAHSVTSHSQHTRRTQSPKQRTILKQVLTADSAVVRPKQRTFSQQVELIIAWFQA